MARQTRHSRNRKPGVTIDGTAEDKTGAKAATGDAKVDSVKAGAGNADNPKTGADGTTGGAVGGATDKPSAANAPGASGSGTTEGPVPTPAQADPSKPSRDASDTAKSADEVKGDASETTDPKADGPKTDASKSAATRSMMAASKPDDAKTGEARSASSTSSSDLGRPGGASTLGTGASMGDAKTTDTKAGDGKAGDPKAGGTKATGTGSSGPSTAPATTIDAGRTGSPSPASSTPVAAAHAARPTGDGDGDAARAERRADNGNGNRGLSPLVAGLLGGAIALAGAWLLGLLGLFGGADDDVAALRTEVAALRDADGADVSALDDRVVAVVDERIAEAAAASGEQGTIDTAVITSIDERLARLEADEGARLDAGGLTPEIEARLAELGAGDGLTPQIEQRLAQLEAGLGAGDVQGRQAIAALEARLEEIAGTQGAQDQTVAGVLANLEQSGAIADETFARLDGLNDQLGTLNAGVEGVRGEVGTLSVTVDEQVAQIGTLRGQIDTVRGAVEEASANVDTVAADLGQQIQAVRGTASNANAAIQSVRGTVQDLTGRADEIASNVEAVRTDLTNATGRLDDVAGRVDDVSNRVDTLAGTASGNEQRIAALAAELEEARTDRTIARALAANTLQTTIDRGLPFAAELEAYAAVAESTEGLEPLREFAGRGVPTLPELEERFQAAARAVKEVSIEVDPGAGFFDRLAASAQSTVSVREVGELTGESTDAVLARMEQALERANLERVLAEAQYLGVDEQRAAAPFLRDVRARLAADRLIDDALGQALRSAG